MYNRKTSLLLAMMFMAVYCFAQTSHNNTPSYLDNTGQDLLAVKYTSPHSVKKSDKPTSSTRFHQRLSGTFSGLAIELIASDLPLERSLPLFRQFGNVHYDKLEKGGYSYIIKTNFDDKKSLEKFYNTVILPRNPAAKMVEYKFGKRNIL